MNYILDNPETENQFKHILRLIKSRKNGETVALMARSRVTYKTSWGVPVVELREIAQWFPKDHLLALKLWNKQWRETMILATLIDEPDKVTEEQMDFVTKNFENTEIAEQASANLWVYSRFAFAKALEWCRGKKHLVRYTGIHLAGRLAITAKNDPAEMFEPFFEEFGILARDPKLHTVLYRAIISIAVKSVDLKNMAIQFSEQLMASGNETSIKLGDSLRNELNYL